MKNLNQIREIVRALILEELLAEPDELESEKDQEAQDEQSVTASISGVTVPLGRGPTYPADKTLEKNPKRKTKKHENLRI
jgi:hypothetical protein